LTKFITNLVPVIPGGDEVQLLRVWNTSHDQVNQFPQYFWNTVTCVVNNYTKNFVATILGRGYGNLEPGVYIASIGKAIDKNEFREELSSAVEEYKSKFIGGVKYVECRVEVWGRNDVENFAQSVNYLDNDIKDKRVPSKSYIITNLLNNLLIKALPRDLLCKEKVGTKICIQLDIDKLGELRELADNKDFVDPLFEFCNDYPGLCGKKENGCKFFKVVKQINVRFQHSENIKVNEGKEVDLPEAIYLVLYSHYRRLSNLNLKDIIKFLLAKDVDLNNALRDVRVNVRLKEERGRGTMLYEIEEVDWVNRHIKLRDVDEDVMITIRYDEGSDRLISEEDGVEYEVVINPTYKKSREFIRDYLCSQFDEHKKKLSWIPHYEYFTIFEHDLRVFSDLLKLNGIKLNLGGITYTVKDRFVKVR